MHGVGVFVVVFAIVIASRCSSGLQTFDHLRACATARARVGPITIGGRSDHSRYRHFKGAMRSVSIYSSALTPTEIQCIFTHDDAVFSGALAPSSNGATVACPAIVWLALLAMSVWCQ